MTVSTPQLRQQAAVAQLWLRRGTSRLRVVLVEPSRAEARPLESELRAAGVEVVCFDQPMRAMVAIGRIGADLVIASANLGRNKLRQTCETVRDEFGVPVLLAYGANDVHVIRDAVLAGARPVLRLPFDIVEVLHTLATIEPPAHPREDPLVVGDLALLPGAHSTRVGGHGVDLSPIEFSLLTQLATSPDQAVPRTVLIGRIWPNAADPDSALAATTRRLRAKLARAGLSRAVHTVRGVGYRLESRECTIDARRDVTLSSISSTILATSGALRPTGS